MYLFNTKFFCTEAKFSIVELERMRQHPGQDMDIYMRRFHERAIDCCDPAAEEILVDICLRGMMEEYHKFLENLSFSSLSRLMEAAMRTNESVRRTSRSSNGASRPSPTVRPQSRKRPIVATLKEGKGSRPSSSKRPSFDKKEPRQFPILPLFPCGAKKAIA